MSTAISTREAYGLALRELGATHAFYVLDADLAKATFTDTFAQAFPDRFFDMGIAEANMMGTAAGMAAAGATVFTSTFAMFAAGRAYEQLRNAIAYPKLNVKIGATHGGVLIGEDGASHQCVEDIALMRVLPNMNVLVPCDAESTRWAVQTALETDGPFYLRFNRFATPSVYGRAAPLALGKASALRRGGDVALLAVGDMVCEALAAAELLARHGIEATVADMCSVKPLDAAFVAEIAGRVRWVLTAEDHSVIGGLGGAVAEAMAASGSGAKLLRMGLQDCFGCSGKRAELAQRFGLHARALADACLGAWEQA
ncbi:MAG TPA: transketolase C-terminal domain-containing protein [Clostridia bacterium]|nr:transketolase C-terminal domain-containing protein [Clostridia bacterium]